MVTTTNIILIIVALLVIWVIAIFNGLVRGRMRVREAWSDIEVQLKRRYDLIPNLVETVKGYMTHEKDVLEGVTLARAQALQAQDKGAKASAENALSGTLKTLFAVSESYPDLKANTNFIELQRELSDTENKIQAARRFYNGNVLDYNTKIGVFPSNIIAGSFSFTKEEFFQLTEEAAKEPVKVSF